MKRKKNEKGATAQCQGLAVGGSCFAEADGFRPWTPWIRGILNFRSNGVVHNFNVKFPCPPKIQ